jgi:subtilisin-like proprotein convertase family protein
MTHAFQRGRKGLALLLATALLSIGAIGATAGTASAATTTFSNPGAISIPDNTTASPYPSTINVSGLAGNVQKATVTLRSFTHTCPDDLAVLLVGPSGARSILMGNVGGCPQTDIGLINLTFDQAALSALNDVDTALSGTYRPSESGPTSSLTPPAPGSPYPVSLDVFNGTPANGAWSLFIEDQVGVDVGLVAGGWSLTLNAPVNTMTTGKPKLNKKKGTARLPVTVGDSGQLTLSGKGVKAASATKSVAVAGPGTVNLPVKPKGKTRRKLNSTGKATVKVTITFTPTGGSSNVQTKKIKLKKTLG